MTPRRRVLVISYFYPPYRSVGAVRVSKMTRYLADYGWDATVVTTARDERAADLPVEIPAADIARVAQTFDVLSWPRGLMARTSPGEQRQDTEQQSQRRVTWLLGEAYRHLVCLPDPQIGWRSAAFRESLRLVRELKPDVILTSSLPNTAHMVGAALTQETGVPWVAEFRDLWTDNHNFRRIAPLRQAEQWLERRTLSHAAALVTVSEPWAQLLRQRFAKPAYVVPNGFDAADYPAAAREPSPMFTLAYTGMFYQGKQNPDPLAEAIARLARTGELTPQTFQVRLVGPYLRPVMAAADRAGVSDFFTLDRAVPHGESLNRQVNATALLFFDWFFGAERGWLSAKIYEYLGARRPILSIGPTDSAVGELLAATHAGIAAPTADAVADVLRDWLATWKSTGQLTSESDARLLDRYTRQSAAATMADVLDRVRSSGVR